jgi:hypothetical protein
MTDKRSIVDPGSLLNTSEGLLSTAALATLSTALTTSSDWRVQAASALGVAIIGAAYVVSRALVKKAGEQ